jgi:hypothetical protein
MLQYSKINHELTPKLKEIYDRTINRRKYNGRTINRRNNDHRIMIANIKIINQHYLTLKS